MLGFVVSKLQLFRYHERPRPESHLLAAGEAMQSFLKLVDDSPDIVADETAKEPRLAKIVSPTP